MTVNVQGNVVKEAKEAGYQAYYMPLLRRLSCGKSGFRADVSLRLGSETGNHSDTLSIK